MDGRALRPTPLRSVRQRGPRRQQQQRPLALSQVCVATRASFYPLGSGGAQQGQHSRHSRSMQGDEGGCGNVPLNALTSSLATPRHLLSPTQTTNSDGNGKRKKNNNMSLGQTKIPCIEATTLITLHSSVPHWLIILAKGTKAVTLFPHPPALPY